MKSNPVLTYLDKVRGYPESKRRQLLLVWTIGLTVAIVLFWLANLWLLGGGAQSNRPTLNVIETLAVEVERIKLGLETAVNFLID
jgi:hypothetical protein